MNKTWIVIITIIITAGIAVGASYYYLNNKAEEEKAGLQSQIDELNDQVSDLQSQSLTTDESSETSTDDETADWQTYLNEDIGFSFKYPSDVTSNESNDQYFAVRVNNITTMEDMPLGYDKASAQSDKNALADNDPTTAFGMAIEDSYKMLDVTDALAKELTILGQLEVCDVQFKREAIIYAGDYQIIIDLISNEKEEIIENNSGYFKSDPTVCGTPKLWSDKDGFYAKLVNGTSDSVSQAWFTNFDKIIATFEFTD